MRDIDLANILDRKIVREFSKLFYSFTGMTTSFSFSRWKKGPVDFIPRYAKCKFCQTVQSSPKSMEICRLSGIDAEEKMRRNTKPFIYTCRLGITWIGVPVYIQGQYVGGVWAGDVISREPNAAQFSQIRRKLKGADLDLDEIEEAYYDIPVLDRGQLRISLELLALIVSYVVDKEQNAILSESIYQKQKEVSDAMAARLELEKDLQEKMGEVQTLRKQYLAATGISQSATLTDDTGTRYSRIVCEALAVIDKYYQEDITLNDVAEHINLSPNYLSTIFHRECGCKFAEYIMQKRISKACELLQDLHLNVTEVGMRVGYYNVRYFGQLFKKIMGMPPSEYRNRLSVNSQDRPDVVAENPGICNVE